VAALFERRMRNLISLIVRSVDFAIRAHCCAIYRDRARSTHTAGLKTALFVFLTKYVKSGSAVAFPLPQRRHFVPGTWSFPPDRVPLCGHRHEGDPMPSGANDEAAVAEFIRKRGIQGIHPEAVVGFFIKRHTGVVLPNYPSNET